MLLIFRHGGLNGNETLFNYEAAVRCKDGSIKTVQISSNVYRQDEKFVHTRCFTIDITEQKKLIQALQESEQRFRQLSVELERNIEQRMQDLNKKERRAAPQRGTLPQND